MNMKCRDLSRLKSFENIRLIAGAGELVFITGMENGFSDSTLISIVRECIENAATGIVVLINPEYIGFIPEEVISTAENGNMPLYEMPWKIKLVDVTKEIANTIIINQLHEQSVMGFFSELLFSHYISDASIKNMGIRCGVDVDEAASMMIIRPIYTRECQRNDFDNVISALNRAIDNELERHRINYVSYVYMDEIFIYAVCRSNELSGVRDIVTAVCNNHAEKYSGLQICGGIGRVTAGAENFRRSYSEARQALSLSEDDVTPVRIVMYSEMGIIRLLTSASSRGEIKDYCYSTLMPLIDSDRQHNTEYIKTLYTYLRCNCNLIKTAETMFIHRNTIVYRVEKIRSLLDIDFSDMTAKSECMNALRFMKHFGFQPEDFE